MSAVLMRVGVSSCMYVHILVFGPLSHRALHFNLIGHSSFSAGKVVWRAVSGATFAGVLCVFVIHTNALFTRSNARLAKAAMTDAMIYSSFSIIWILRTEADYASVPSGTVLCSATRVDVPHFVIALLHVPHS